MHKNYCPKNMKAKNDDNQDSHSFYEFKLSPLNLEYSKSTPQRIDERGIDEGAIKSNGIFRVTYQNIIVVYKLPEHIHKKVYIYYVYQYATKGGVGRILSQQKLDQFQSLVDSVVASTIFEEYESCREQLRNLRGYCNNIFLKDLQKVELQDLYSILISVAAPAFQDVFHLDLELNDNLLGINH